MSIRLIALFSVVALAACGSTSKKADTATDTGETQFTEHSNPIVRARLEARVENIKYQKGVTLVTNLERIISYGEVAVPACLEGLESEDAMTRMGSAYCLGRIGNTKVIPDLEQVLDDEVSFVRYEAAAALATLGSKSGYPVLVQGLEDDRVQFRYKCFEALRDTTGQSFGYSHNAAPEVRQVSVQKWQEWLERVQSEDL